MGILSTNRYSTLDTDYVFEANMNYEGDIGFAIAALESYQEDMVSFNHILESDFQDAAAVKEGATDEELYIFREGALASAWDALKKFFKSLWEKIKGIFENFMAKFKAAMIKDYTKAFTKNQGALIAKDYKGCKVKFDMPRTSTSLSILTTAADVDISLSIKQRDDAEERLKNFDPDVYFDNLLNDAHLDPNDHTVEGICAAQISKIFDGEKERELSGDLFKAGGFIAKCLDLDILDSVKDVYNYLENKINNLLKEIDAFLKEAKSDKPKFNTGNYNISFGSRLDQGGHKILDIEEKNLKNDQAALRLARNKAIIIQRYITALSQASIKTAQYATDNAKKVFRAAMAWNPKKAKNEAAEEYNTDLFSFAE